MTKLEILKLFSMFLFLLTVEIGTIAMVQAVGLARGSFYAVTLIAWAVVFRSFLPIEED